MQTVKTERKRKKLIQNLVFIACNMAVFIAILSIGFPQQIKLEDLGKERYETLKTINELRQSSENLTRMIRTFAVTGDTAYLRQYNQVLSIRSGEVPRPVQYDQYFWDNYYDGSSSYVWNGTEILMPFDSLLSSIGFSKEEENLLLEAEKMSNQLAILESEVGNDLLLYYAERNRGQYNTTDSVAKSIQRLFCQDYSEAKAKVLAPINLAIQMVDERLNQQIEQQERLIRFIIFGLIVSVISIVTLIIRMFFIARSYNDALFSDLRNEILLQTNRIESQELRYKVLFENMNEGFAEHEMIYDDDEQPFDYRYIEVNPAFTKLTGLTKELAIGKTVRQLIPGIENDEAGWIEKYGHITKTGDESTFEDYSEPLGKWFRVHAFKSDDNRFALTFSDITENKLQQLEIDKTMLELESTNNELERFAYIASHDLREPLRKINSYIGLIQKRASNSFDESSLRYFDVVVSGATRMQTMIDDLLTFSRAISKEIIPVDIKLDQLIHEVCEMLEVSIKESGAQVTISKLPVVRGDEGQLRQVFQNLISNALKFTADNSPDILINATETEASWIIEVKDNGIGFEMEQAGKLFNIFTRLHSRDKYSGTGIGLSICKKIIRRHQGKIWAESSPGQGASFYVELKK